MPTHVSLFKALLICWQKSGYAHPFSITPKILMGYAKIASISTYYRCIQDLDGYGYILYGHPITRSREALFIGLSLQGHWKVCKEFESRALKQIKKTEVNNRKKYFSCANNSPIEKAWDPHIVRHWDHHIWISTYIYISISIYHRMYIST